MFYHGNFITNNKTLDNFEQHILKSTYIEKFVALNLWLPDSLTHSPRSKFKVDFIVNRVGMKWKQLATLPQVATEHRPDIECIYSSSDNLLYKAGLGSYMTWQMTARYIL